ncbi:MAG: 2-amino-4-hydroxy-6-hydroxymethyldihydropteridine diphosphokinase [Desulfobacterales bacterium]|jgi:2-amino-4-hydroxy-6-hydroxymethyldihydropteridine diphosphokinase|nr:2-amino-4-hydroxy-6-hydroxymethyldihydropteridine diphosphokinase [Desulfobacterales bacterium]
MTNTAYISFGSNMGDRITNCATGIRLLDGTADVNVERISEYYLTEPMDFADQDWFVNGAIKIGTLLDPLKLLSVLKSIEMKVGRKKSRVRFGPRVLDFDIIFYNNEFIDTPQLIVPHPRMHCREFVLRPMCDLAPGLIHPILHKNIKDLMQGLKDNRPQCIKINTRLQGEPIPVLKYPNTADQEETANEVFY